MKHIIYLIIFLFISPVLAMPVTEYSDVLLVTNQNSTDSIFISDTFMYNRNITHRVNLTLTTDESVSFTVFNNSIRKPIQDYLNNNSINQTINYIVLTKGVPIRYNADSNCRVNSVDNTLTIILSPTYSSNICAGTTTTAGRTSNPMYNSLIKANKTYYDMYIVTRLDGYTKEDAVRLFNLSTNNTFNISGRYLFDANPSKTGGYATWNEQIGQAHVYLNSTINISPGIFDNTTTFRTDRYNISGYYSWGSNDGSANSNSSTWNLSFNYGSYADTAVSTSGRSFVIGTTYGQSLIADLVSDNVSFVKGYTNEPYLSAISKPNIMVNRYYGNYTISESMYMSSQYINWMDIYIGDPKMKNTRVAYIQISNTSNTTSGCASDYPNTQFVCNSVACYYLDSTCETNFTYSSTKYTCTTSSCV